MGHEEAHAARYDNGLVAEDIKLDFRDKQYLNKTLEFLENRRNHEEAEASHIENIIRTEIDPTGNIVPLRQFYKFPWGQRIINGKPVTYEYAPLNVIRPGYNYYKKSK